MVSLKRKLSVFFLGLIFSLFFLELILRLIGIAYSRAGYSTVSRDNSTYTILCLGDSLTVGCGAERDKSYPRQLEGLLNADPQGRRVVVLNMAVAGQNSSQLLAELPKNIKNIKPKLITVLTGNANFWNFFGYLKSKGKNNVLSGLNDRLYRLRIFKLAKLLFLNLKMRSRPQSLWYHNQDTDTAAVSAMGFGDEIKYLKAKIAANGQDNQSCLKLGEIYNEQDNYNEAKRWYGEAIRIDPLDSRGYHGMGIACLGKTGYSEKAKLEEAVLWFEKSIEADPKFWRGYSSLSGVYLGLGRYDQAIDFFKNLEKKEPALKDFCKMFEKKLSMDKEIKQWVTQDMENIVKICKENDIAIILQNYPLDKRSVSISKEIADKLHVPFVDHYAVFDELLMQEGYSYSNYFTRDRHCNAKGYAIMAKNIYEKIKEEKIIGE